MKTSLSFISTTLATNDKKGKLSHQEISQLQDRLASTEAQMYKILSALDAASSKVQEITKNTRQSLEQRPQVCVENETNTMTDLIYFFSDCSLRSTKIVLVSPRDLRVVVRVIFLTVMKIPIIQMSVCSAMINEMKKKVPQRHPATTMMMTPWVMRMRKISMINPKHHPDDMESWIPITDVIHP